MTWFDDALASLVAQDYPNLSILVIDAASDKDPTPRVARASRDVFVRRLGTDPGYGRAANQAPARRTSSTACVIPSAVSRGLREIMRRGESLLRRSP